MKKVAIIQARMGSTRFPGKVLEPLLDKPILAWVVNAAQNIPTIDEVIVATSVTEADQAIVKWCEKMDVRVFQGSEEDVLSRYYEAASFFKADVVMRITADCPLLDPMIAGQVLHLVSQGHADYASNALPPTWPDGLDCEAFTFKALEYAHKNGSRQSDREHVTPFIHNNQKLFKTLNVSSPIPGLYKHRWTVDSPEDLKYLEEVLKSYGKEISTYGLLDFLAHSKDLIQPPNKRNEGFVKSLEAESAKCEDFKNSHKLLERALKVIPLGSQTFSKSYIQYPQNTSPLFLTHGFESHVWDVDGNEYVDLVSALLPNVLGYADPDVNFAIHAQLQKGITLSLATELEVELAEKLCSIIPSAQKVRFAKNGTDVTSAAIRLARAYTGREKILVCGYHGWQDWYIGSTSRNKGVPKEVCKLTTSVPYNDLQIIHELLSTTDYAAIIMEPSNSQEPLPGYLQGIKDACEKYGSIFIFDEIITGFRLALGGAQEFYGVTPHLSCFGKAMGNGMPISAIVGRNDIMNEMEEIFFSGTFGGEALSLAASLATIKKIEEEKVIDHLWSFGESLSNEVSSLVEKYDLGDIFKFCGSAPWKIIQFLDHANSSSAEIRTYFLQEMIKRGILVLGTHNITYAHQQGDRARIVKAYDETFDLLSKHLANATISNALESSIIQPLFKVRK
jgi:glutamate-1-semialdehyde 2,1-aminomutase/spore coat polysaccharide biosynthesis protein SpsF